MSLILDLRGRTSHAGTPLVHPTSENVVLANVFGIVRNLSFDAILHPWLSDITHNKIFTLGDWQFSFWEKQPKPVGIREESTEVDLVLCSPKALVFVEVKMDAEPSAGTSHDPERNQLVRNLDIGYQRATNKEQTFSLVYVTPDTREPEIVDRIRSADRLFPANPKIDPRTISECLFWSSWSTLGDVIARSYKDRQLDDIEQRFALDLLAYLVKKGLWKNNLPDNPIFHNNKLYRSLRPTNSPFIPYSERKRKRDESWRTEAWDEVSLRKLLKSLRWEDKLLLKVLAEAEGVMRQDRIMEAVPFLKGKNSASLRSLKSHINAECKGCGRAPILAVGSGTGDQRVHEFNPSLGKLLKIVIDEAKTFEIPRSLLE